MLMRPEAVTTTVVSRSILLLSRQVSALVPTAVFLSPAKSFRLRGVEQRVA